jgi:excisionase family DNA binding protein
MMTEQEGRFEGVEEVAERLLVDPQTVRRWIKSGKLKAYKPGREYRILSNDLDSFLEARSSPKDRSRPSPKAPEEVGEERREPRRVDKEELEQTLERLKPFNQELRQEFEQYDKEDSFPLQDRIREVVAFEESCTADLMEQGILDFARAVIRSGDVRLMTSKDIQLLCLQLLREFELMQSYVAEIRLRKGPREAEIPNILANLSSKLDVTAELPAKVSE